VALGNRAADECRGLGIVVAFHKGGNVTTIPRGHLIVQHAAYLLLGRGSQQRQRSHYAEQLLHMRSVQATVRGMKPPEYNMNVTDVQLYLAIGIPTLAVLAGILTNVAQSSALNARFNSLETRMDARFNGVDARFNNLEVKFDVLTGKVIDLDNRVTRIEAKLDD
jgi:hypothetical protein